MDKRKVSAAVCLSCLLTLSAGASVSDYTRTVVSTKLNGWEGVQFIKWTKSGLVDVGRAWAVKFDLTKGYRLRTQFGDESRNRATVGAMAECVAADEGVVPIMGLNADYFNTDVTAAQCSGLVITDDELVSRGWTESTTPEMCYIMQTADGNLVHSAMTRHVLFPSGCPTASWQVSANGRKIRQAIRTNFCNYPVRAGMINPVGGSSGGAVFPTTIGNMQSRTAYPRPLVGIGTNAVGVATNLVLFVNDGRQLGWSVDFPDVDAYQIMINEGCNEVGEFDGGGSAAMWMAFGADSEYNFGTDYKTAHGNYVNRPSDGSPRKDACGVFVLPPKKVNWTVEVNDGNHYADMDGAFKAVAPGDTVKVKANAVFVAGVVPRNCTITATDPAKVECAMLSVLSGVRVLLRDVAFRLGDAASPLTVEDGGTAAVAGGVGVAKVITSNPSGFEVAEPLTVDLVVDCAVAESAGQTFGTSALSVAEVETSLKHIRHPTDRTLVAKAVAGTNGTELVWKVGVTFTGTSDGEGFNYTNRTVSVAIGSIDGDFGDGAKLRLKVSDVLGTLVATVDRELKGVGVYSFDTAEASSSLIAPGRNYAYEVTIVDAAGQTFAGVDSAKGSFKTAADANWFAALAKDDSEIGGQWRVKPEIKDKVYSLTSGTTFAFEPTPAEDGIVQVTEEGRFEGGYSNDRLDELCRTCEVNPPQSMFTLKERDDESLVWVGLVRESGRLMYKELFGVSPEGGRFYTCRQEVDYGKGTPRVSYLVADSSGDFVRLTDEAGQAWFDGPNPQRRRVSSIELEGVAKVLGIVGEKADESLMHVDGKDIVLMTNVILDPTQLTPGEYAVSREGHAFRWTDNGRSATYDESTGAFKVSVSAPKNGYESYVSYVLNMDPEDPDSRPIARFVRDETTGKTKIGLVLANGKPFEPRSQEQTGFSVKVALESSDTVGFADSQMGEKHLPDDFGPEIGMAEAPRQFFRCRIFFEK